MVYRIKVKLLGVLMVTHAGHVWQIAGYGLNLIHKRVTDSSIVLIFQNFILAILLTKQNLKLKNLHHSK